MTQTPKYCVVPWCDNEPVVQTLARVDLPAVTDEKRVSMEAWVWCCREHGPKVGDDV
jgi:hypothetical protein